MFLDSIETLHGKVSWHTCQMYEVYISDLHRSTKDKEPNANLTPAFTLISTM